MGARLSVVGPQMADLILSEEGMSSSHYGVCYTRGFIGVMTFLWHGDFDESINIMLPCLEAVTQLPGIQRMHPWCVPATTTRQQDQTC